ncbi:hypothetical protein Gasu_12010 isoform 1 [Galdieria sulphuraria]|uniref:GIY-YIG domain-containing protein n=1 Tax=Galdieria sulphuraria TaxID=130081 RepID=M2W6U4_GALSU|nr:hypothetical protein Gasu_12010 isoform 1 [Galdieria sulphuraria]EME31526.1 hypothetical protein isoform 1 [Galdieria sulphuraria]|eukprot:XP_005708046.1 hypothetical protein isoform 1 [Galdieria sulphuraria]
MSTNHKSRPRYLQELPMIPIDEIYAKSFRWNRTGCYALYNDDHLLCYVGYTKNLQKKIAFHAKLQPNQCKFFKAYVVDNPKVSASFLEKILDSWLLEYGSVPPGNSSERHLWEGKRDIDRKGVVLLKKRYKAQGLIVQRVLELTTFSMEKIPLRFGQNFPKIWNAKIIYKPGFLWQPSLDYRFCCG